MALAQKVPLRSIVAVKPRIETHVMAPLTLHLSGSFRLTAPDGAPVDGLSRRGQALLAWLACQPGMRGERAAVADLLWSDRSEEQARASLRQELSVLRRRLPEGALLADRQALWLDPGRVAVTRDGAGAFLQGFDLASEGFEDWLRGERQREPEPAARRPAPDPAAEAARSRASLAVMPFEEFGAAEADMFASGVVEEITNALSRVHEFDTIARQSAFALTGASLGVPEIAGRLGADYLVEGSVRRSGDRVRISVQLVRGADGHTLWAERFDDRMDDLFDLQDRIAAQVAGQVAPNLRSAEIARVATKPPTDRSAYDLVLTALPHFWAHRRAANARAVALLDEALVRDPEYGPALAYKAWAVAQQPSYMWSTDPAADRATALEIAAEAEKRTTDHAPSLVAISAAVSLVSTQTDRARSAVERALAIDPNNAWGWMRMGWVCNYEARFTDAHASFDRAEALSPLDPFRFNMTIGRAAAYANSGDLEQGVTLIRKGLLQAPGIEWANRLLVSWLTQLGRMDEARVAMEDFMRAYPGLTLEFLIKSVPPTLVEQNWQHYSALLEIGLPER